MQEQITTMVHHSKTAKNQKQNENLKKQSEKKKSIILKEKIVRLPIFHY